MIRHRRRTFVGLASMVTLFGVMSGCTTTPKDLNARSYEAVIASEIRTDQDRRMDQARKPAQFLPFTQVKPGMQVLDVSAGGGYTSSCWRSRLARAERCGRKRRARSDADEARCRSSSSEPDRRRASLRRPDPRSGGKLDLITIILNYHDISYLPVDRAKMNARLFAALQPGGRMVVIDHSARSGTGISDGRTLHRIDEAVVRAELRQAGFVIDAESDFLRNPADPRDQSSNEPKIPTDKFALRFIKPK